MQKKMVEECKKRLGILLDMGLWDEVTKAFEKNGTTCLSEIKVLFGVCGINFTFDEMPEFKAVKEQFEYSMNAVCIKVFYQIRLVVNCLPFCMFLIMRKSGKMTEGN